MMQNAFYSTIHFEPSHNQGWQVDFVSFLDLQDQKDLEVKLRLSVASVKHIR